MSYTFSLSVRAAVDVCPTNLIAGRADSEKFKILYEWAFYRSEFYRQGACPTNIANYMRLLKACHVDLKQTKVIYLTETNLKLFLNNGRTNPDTWYFHVVALHNNMIFDFDNGEKAAVQTVQDYFNTMFVDRRSDSWKDIGARIIPAAEYAELYDADRTSDYGFYYWLLPERSSFSEISIPQLLSGYLK